MDVRTLDLFHGAGGSSIGARMAGARIAAAIDHWEVAARTYRENVPEAEVITEDIRKVKTEDLRKRIGEIDLILASPECTNHSCAKGASIRDETSKLTAFEVLRFAREFRPKWIVIENVVQMGRWNRHVELLGQMREMGYTVREEKLNAQNFGVPQSRRRLFVLCSLSGGDFKLEDDGRKPKSANEVIDTSDVYAFTPLHSQKRALATIERAERAISALGSKTPFLIVYYGSDGAGGWQSIERPLRTVTTIDRFAYVKPNGSGHVMRMLQPEELKRAMGFGTDYVMRFGSRRDKVKLMGNAVCPPVMRELVGRITQIS